MFSLFKKRISADDILEQEIFRLQENSKQKCEFKSSSRAEKKELKAKAFALKSSGNVLFQQSSNTYDYDSQGQIYQYLNDLSKK